MLLFPVYTSATAHLGNGCRTVGGWAVIEIESERQGLLCSTSDLGPWLKRKGGGRGCLGAEVSLKQHGSLSLLPCAGPRAPELDP